MRTRRALAVVGAALVGAVVGSTLTIAVQGKVPPADHPTGSAPPSPFGVAERPDTFLAWTPGGLPAGFERHVGALPAIRDLG
ncbi:MAG TPA: hypothetical protein VF029_05835, partial [Actinomycetota bacterium]